MLIVSIVAAFFLIPTTATALQAVDSGQPFGQVADDVGSDAGHECSGFNSVLRGWIAEVAPESVKHERYSA